VAKLGFIDVAAVEYVERQEQRNSELCPSRLANKDVPANAVGLTMMGSRAVRGRGNERKSEFHCRDKVSL